MRRTMLLMVLVTSLVWAGGIVVRQAEAIGPETYVVNTLANDVGVNNGDCGDGLCTLSDAITSANAHANDGGPDRIEFALTPPSDGTMIFNVDPPLGFPELPAITEGVVLDASVGTGSSCANHRLRFEIRGPIGGPGSDPTGITGLRIQGNGTTVRGVQVTGFGSAIAGAGIQMSGSGHLIECSNIGIASVFAGGVDTFLDGGNAFGILIVGGHDIQIGNNSPALRNLFGYNGGPATCDSPNFGAAVVVDASSSNVTIQNAYIGHEGTFAAPNASGILIKGATGTLIRNNSIAGNDGVAIELTAGATGTRIFGNTVGRNGNGDPLANCRGLWTNGGTTGTLSAFNEWAYSKFLGANISDANALTKESIHDNGLSGLQSTTPWLPVITSATGPVAGVGLASAELQLTPAELGKPIVFEFYASPACDPSGFGEGELFVGDDAAAIQADGRAAVANVPLAFPSGWVLTIFARMSLSGTTSGFSACVTPATPAVAPALSNVSPPSLTASAAAGAVVSFDVSGYMPGTTSFQVTGNGASAGSLAVQDLGGGNAHVTFTPYASAALAGTVEISASNGTSHSNFLLLLVTAQPAAVLDSDVDSSTAAGDPVSATAGGGGGPSVTASSLGPATIGVAIYGSNPGATPSFQAGTFFDVYVSPGLGTNQVVIQACGVGSGLLQWFNGVSWGPVSGATFAGGCWTFTATPFTSPSVDDLSGTPFTVARPDACLATPTIVGTNGNDVIQGTSGDDVIWGKSGNDKIFGNGGNDLICGGDGNDTIVTGSGNDGINGGDGNDTIEDSGGNNFIVGGDGNDRITTADGDDSIDSGDGNDTINAGGGRNSVRSGDGNDSVTTGDGDDLVHSGEGNDKISTGSGNDLVVAGDGNDKVDGGDGFDICNAGSGNNKVVNCEG